MKYTYIDLFAGCGGLSDGFEKTTKFSGIAHVEWERIAAKTLSNRLEKRWSVSDANDRVMVFDIQRTRELIQGWSDPSFGEHPGLKSFFGSTKRVDVLIGGPPCQAYSLAGRIRDENGMQNDYRNFLFESYINVMNWCQPDIFLFENVVGVLSANPGGVPIVERVKCAFSAAGYTTLHDFRQAVFSLDRYEVPQKRARVIIIGLRNKTFGGTNKAQNLLEHFYADLKQRYATTVIRSAREAIGDLPPLYPIKNPTSNKKRVSHTQHDRPIRNHIPRFHNQRDQEIFRLLASDLQMGENRYTSTAALKALYTERTGRTSAVHKYHVLRPDQPSNTIPAHLYKDGLRHIHWDADQARSITVREAARLQGFDDEFEFLGSLSDQYKMIGNAVPPIFSNKLADALATFLDTRR